MKSIIVALALATSANASVTLVDTIQASIHTTVIHLDSGLYSYNYEFLNPEATLGFTLEFRDDRLVAGSYQFLQGATIAPGQFEGIVWFLRDFDQERIEFVSFVSSAPPVPMTLMQDYYTSLGYHRQIVRDGYGPQPVPEPGYVLISSLSIFFLLIRRR